MTYFLAGYNPTTGLWDVLDQDVPSSECLVLRDQLLSETNYTVINIVPENV